MSKEGVYFVSGLDRRTELIFRAFEGKNDLTRAQLLRILAHFLAGYSATKVFDGKVREFNPHYEAFDRAVRDFMEKNTPQEYQRIPLLQRLFGRVYKPLVKADLEKIDAILKAEESEAKEPPKEAPDVDTEQVG